MVIELLIYRNAMGQDTIIIDRVSGLAEGVLRLPVAMSWPLWMDPRTEGHINGVPMKRPDIPGMIDGPP